MYKKPRGFDPYLLTKAIEFAKGIISIEDYLAIRDDGRKKWVEMRELVKEPYMFNLYINRLPFNYRLKALKEIHNLANNEIRQMRQNQFFSGQIDEFFKGNFSINSISNYLYELAIILDTPIEYLIYENPMKQNVNTNQFSEYKKLNKLIKLAELKEIIGGRPSCRWIDGYCINTSISYSDYYTFVRVDKRVEFYSLEVFVPSITKLNDSIVKSFEVLLPSYKKYIIYSTPLFRDGYKISFIGCYDSNNTHMLYLDNCINEIKLRNHAKEIYPN